MKSYHDLRNSLQHIQKVVEKHTSQQVASNRFQLKVSIEVVKWLTFQGCTLRGRDETEDSTNRGNFLELLSLLASYSDEDEIGEQKFCVIVDEACDESKREQMAIVLRYVDKEGIRGQGYDGANNMCGEFTGLQALILKECPFAYYIHCLAHRLQLTLVGASKEVIPVEQFFSYLTIIINLVISSCKRKDQLREAQASHIANMIAFEGIDTRKGKIKLTLYNVQEIQSGVHI
ncbi:hypothetical protein GQ457_05G018700 [Hibiscus cannabinus]